MRNLRERLMAVATQPKRVEPKPENESPFFLRVHRVPLHRLNGIERTALDEIRACDPGFDGMQWDARRLLFLDTETTGLSGGAGTVAFEIGIGYIDGGEMIIRQYVMRDYSEEPAMLQDIAGLLPRFDTLVTFNGKSFDVPLLESRMILSRIRTKLSAMPHLDLLHAARRVYKLRLKRCSLSALEEAVLGVGRTDDLPGAQVPQRYFDYLKTKEFALLEDVLRHNLLDVQNLASLTGHLCAVYRAPEQLGFAEDIFSVGRTLMRGGKTGKARECLKILGHSSLSSQAHMHLAASYKKERDWAEAVSSWQTMIACGEGGVWPYIELSKYYEHIARDVPRALRCALQALALALNTAAIAGEDEKELAALRKRIERLRRKERSARDRSASARMGG